MQETTMPGTFCVLTGERHKGHYLVHLQDKIVELTCGSLMVLLDLLVARAGPGTGFVPVQPVAIARLRAVLDHAFGPGTGHALIETGCAQEYRLTIAPDRLAEQVAFSTSFFELEGLGVISRERAEQIRKLWPAAKSP